MTKKSVLVVDDTESNIDMLVEFLGDDYEVSVAMDGETALEIANDDLPDLILLDIMMPDMDGYEVCRNLKESDKTKHIPIMFLTGATDDASREKGLGLGAVDYILKPIDQNRLQSKVNGFFNL